MLNQSVKCGFIAIIGQPNVGKSTLINHLIGQKISITSKKAQTTRYQIKGIYNDQDSQLIFIDTPGFQNIHQNIFNQKLNENVLITIKEVDIILFIVEANRFNEMEQNILNILPNNIPTLLVINKIDKLHSIELEAFMQKITPLYSFIDTEVVSAKHGLRITHLIAKIKNYLPEGIRLYPEDMLTDRPTRFLVAEIIREKIFRYIGEELPYQTNVEIELFKPQENIIHIEATILIERINHKAIMIGKNGKKLKKISTEARLDMEKLLDSKVFLKIWVKVKSGWANDIRFLKDLTS